MEDETRDYELTTSYPNKSINPDGSVTDLFGNPVDPDEADIGWVNKPALPNKWLNPDGTYSTLAELVAQAVDVNIFVVVDELPAEGDPVKIYIVPNGTGGFDEYRWTGTKWDQIGMIEFDITQYDTKEQVNAKITAALNQAKAYADEKDAENLQAAKSYADGKASTAETNAKNYADSLAGNYDPAGSANTAENNANTYTDNKIASFVPLQNFDRSFVTDGTTVQFFNSIKAKNYLAGSMFLGLVELSDMPAGLIQAEVQVEVYPNNVLYATMRSADLAPYEWTANSYDYRGWEAACTGNNNIYEWDGQNSTTNPDNLILWSNILKEARNHTVLVAGPNCMFVIHQNQNEPMTMTYYSMLNRDIDMVTGVFGYGTISVSITTSDSNFTVSNVGGMVSYANYPVDMQYVDEATKNIYYITETINGTGITSGSAFNFWKNLYDPSNNKPFIVNFKTSWGMNGAKPANYTWYFANHNFADNTEYIAQCDINGRVYEGTSKTEIDMSQATIKFHISNGVIQSIDGDYVLHGNFYLDTDTNYATPYTPTYNGSPATKKYVDDQITNNITNVLGGEY